MITFATRLAAEARGIPWASSMLQPFGFFSAHDPPVLAPAPYLAWFRPLGPPFYRLVFRARPPRQPVVERALASAPRGDRLAPRARPPVRGPARPLARPGPLLAPPGREAARLAAADGRDRLPLLRPGRRGPACPASSREFLDAGPPPIVFTLGSSAVRDAGRFYEQGAAAAKTLGRRAVLLIGKDPRNRLGDPPRRRRRVRVCPLFRAVSPGLGDRPPGRGRHDGTGDEGREAHAHHALRPRPARQRRADEEARHRPVHLPASLLRDPRRGRIGAIARRPDLSLAGLPRSAIRCDPRTGSARPASPWRTCWRRGPRSPLPRHAENVVPRVLIASV